MSTTLSITTPSEGVNFNLTYTPYDQTAAISSTNSPDNPGPPFTAGFVVAGTGGSEWIFVKAGAAIAAGDACQITTLTSIATPITTTNGLLGDRVGWAQVAIASGAYGWLQIAGAVQNLTVLASAAPNVLLYTTATGGALDDATTTGVKLISGVIITATNGSATAAVAGTLNWPVVGAATT